MPVLRFDNVSKHYAGGRQALSEVTFEVDAGEMLFVTGHSGAGKSTLLKLIHLSERASRGAVLFNERNLRNVRGRQVAMHRREVGVVFQDTEPRLLVADEPTGNLDPTLSAEIMALLESLPERGTSVLVASHDLGLVKRMRKRVLVLGDGRLLDDIRPEDLAE